MKKSKQMEFDIMKTEGTGGTPEQLYTKNIASSKIVGKVILFDDKSLPLELPVKPANGGLDLEAMSKRVDEFLAKETPESLSLWFYKHRLLEMYYNLENSPLEEKYKKQFKAFIDGIDSRLSV